MNRNRPTIIHERDLSLHSLVVALTPFLKKKMIQINAQPFNLLAMFQVLNFLLKTAATCPKLILKYLEQTRGKEIPKK